MTTEQPKPYTNKRGEITMTKVTIEFSLDDFDDLVVSSMKSFYTEQKDRFEVISKAYKPNSPFNDIPRSKLLPSEPHPFGEEGGNVSDQGWYMYWLEQGGVTMHIARQVLIQSGFSVYVLNDLAPQDQNETTVILTDYPANWEKDND